ncbi:hypothetical protein RIF29_40693 [Crotalaria pallida]|uniref:Uncharacterized protein n=1 Tax=Crotalaria pallida TaxID=3830 RepID=A0AAN9E4C3_CROPI
MKINTKCFYTYIVMVTNADVASYYIPPCPLNFCSKCMKLKNSSLIMGWDDMMDKPGPCLTTTLAEMAAPAPLAIGTRGTIGSLVRKEIDYFTKFDLDRRGGSQKKPQPHFDMDRSYSMSRPRFWVLLTPWKRRKRRGTSGFIPKNCSVAEVAESNQFNRIPGYSYRILKNDINNFQL